MSTKQAPFQPIIIIGAGRSGTNLLRDILSKLPNTGTWPCDEINYIWRHGNTRFPTDELTPDQATPAVQRFIRGKFSQLAEKYSVEYVIEKTCANSLRVSFVDTIIPNAKYIFIVRDGRDVISSAMKRWGAPLDLAYIAAKAKYVPLSDIPYYGLRYLGNRVYRTLSREKRLASWGPRFEEMQELLQNNSLPVVCAHQWRRCIERAEEDFQTIDTSRVLSIQYEQLTGNSSATIQSILDFLQIEIEDSQIAKLQQTILPNSVGKWQQELSAKTLEDINPIIHSVQKKYGYV